MMKAAMTLTGLKGDPEEIPSWESEDDMAAKSGLR
jgi:hypothetical protein